MTSDGVHVRGLDNLHRTLDAAGHDLADLSDAHADAGALIVARARPPVLTGALRGSLRAIPEPQRLTLTAGVRYGTPVHAGARGRPARPFFTEALTRHQTDLEKTFLEHIETALDQVKGI